MRVWGSPDGPARMESAKPGNVVSPASSSTERFEKARKEGGWFTKSTAIERLRAVEMLRPGVWGLGFRGSGFRVWG